MEDYILSINEVAGNLTLTERTLYRLVQEEQIPGFKAGISWRFKCADIEKWLEDQKERALEAGQEQLTETRRKRP